VLPRASASALRGTVFRLETHLRCPAAARRHGVRVSRACAVRHGAGHVAQRCYVYTRRPLSADGPANDGVAANDGVPGDCPRRALLPSVWPAWLGEASTRGVQASAVVLGAYRRSDWFILREQTRSALHACAPRRRIEPVRMKALCRAGGGRAGGGRGWRRQLGRCKPRRQTTASFLFRTTRSGVLSNVTGWACSEFWAIYQARLTVAYPNPPYSNRPYPRHWGPQDMGWYLFGWPDRIANPLGCHLTSSLVLRRRQSRMPAPPGHSLRWRSSCSALARCCADRNCSRANGLTQARRRN
jgi:hypothetical protein